MRFQQLSITVLTMLLAGPSVAAERSHLLSRAQGRELASKAAMAHGYDLSHYKLDITGNSISQDGREFLYVYQCKPFPPPPGCAFMVAVNRATGSTKIIPGQ